MNEFGERTMRNKLCHLLLLSPIVGGLTTLTELTSHPEQRVAHLNVSALQQVHSYFINILPRIYDRITVADAFAVSYDLLDKTLDLETGQWLFVSYKATKRRGVPVFIQAPDNEATLVKEID
jgi:hypothetical protein